MGWLELIRIELSPDIVGEQVNTMKPNLIIQNRVTCGSPIHFSFVYVNSYVGEDPYLGVNYSTGVVIGQPFGCFYSFPPSSILASRAHIHVRTK